jgi:Flp pilus assembly protein TadG
MTHERVRQRCRAEEVLVDRWTPRWHLVGSARSEHVLRPEALRRARPGRALGQPAQALVEFALIVTMLSVLVTGVVDLGRAFYYDVMVAGSALEGARASAEGAPDNDVTANGVLYPGVFTRVRNTAGPGLGNQLTVSVSPSQAVRANTNGVGLCSPSTCIWTTVTVSYTFTKFTPWMQALTGPTTTITRRVSQRMRSPCAVSPTATACT